MKLVISILLLIASVGVAAERPNIILIMTDDMGRETVGAHGGLSYRTPVLDKMAAEGLVFDHCYSLPICTPSRVKLMTGKYSFRNYIAFGKLDPAEKTFGNALQAAGYETCIVGKWQLGGDHDQIKAFGWDEYCLCNGVRPIDPKAKPYRTGKERYWFARGIVANGAYYKSEEVYGPDMVSEYATNFIKRQRNKPFFLYYPMILPHSPWGPTPHSSGGDKSGEKICEVQYFKDNIEYIDHLVGRVVKALEVSGQRENTLIMFTGDNGSGYPVPVTTSNANMRRIGSLTGWGEHRDGILLKPGDKTPAWKGKVQEGPISETTYGDVPGRKNRMLRDGTGVPCIMDWPRYRKAYQHMGHRHKDLIDFSDFFTTILDVTDTSVDYPIDGVSFASRLRGKGASKRDFIFCHYWRIGRDPKGARDAIHDRHYKLYNNGEFFDLIADPNERKPLNLKQIPEKAMTAHKRLLKAYEGVRGFSIPNHAPSKMYPGPAQVSSAQGVTLEEQLVHAQARAKQKGLKFDRERTIRWFKAKDRNNDGVIDEDEKKQKPPQDWNKQ